MDITKPEDGVDCGAPPDKDEPQPSAPLESSGSMNASKLERKEASDSFTESPAKRIKLHQPIDNNIGEFSSDTTVIPASSDVTSSSTRDSMKGTARVKPESVFFLLAFLLQASYCDLYFDLVLGTLYFLLDPRPSTMPLLQMTMPLRRRRVMIPESA